MQSEGSKVKWLVTTVFFLLLWVLAAVPFLLFRPVTATPFEVQNFVDKAQKYSRPEKSWVPLTRGDNLKLHDRIRTGPKSEVDLQIPGQIRLRLKENSEIEVRRPPLFAKNQSPRLYLRKGILLGSTEKDWSGDPLNLWTPTLLARVQEGGFQVETAPAARQSVVRVLRGTANVRSADRGKAEVLVRSFEKTVVPEKGAPSVPVRIERKDWDKMKEAYELIRKDLLLEARQQDLSKQAGSLFQYVSDHGTFYMDKFGYAEREFFKDEDTGTAHLDIGYDVFPTGSFAGMYMKTRSLDLSQVKAFEFQARTEPEEASPETFRIEFKSGRGTVRAFAPRDFKEMWQTYRFPIHATRPISVSEITFVFSNQKVGEGKRGLLHFRNLNLIPTDTPFPAVQARPARESAVS